MSLRENSYFFVIRILLSQARIGLIRRRFGKRDASARFNIHRERDARGDLKLAIRERSRSQIPLVGILPKNTNLQAYFGRSETQ